MLALVALLIALTLQEAPTSTATAQTTPAPTAEAEKVRARLGELRALAEQAQAALDASNLAEARSLVTEAFEILDCEPPIELDEASVGVVKGLGHIGWRAQAPELARAAWTRVLEARERRLPKDHPDILTARGILAATMVQVGDLAGARVLLEEVLEAQERTLPEDHPDILLARGNLAATILQMGDLAGARALLEAVLKTEERTLPEDHPDILTTRGNLAVTMRRMGDLAGARALQEAVLEASERTLPEDHPDLITARNNLANTMADMGDIAGARVLRESVLEARERTLPEDHPALLTARGNLASTMGLIGDLAGARALQEAVLEARERTLPEDHPATLSARGDLALTMYQMGDIAGARALQEDVLEASTRTLPEDHPDVLMARNNLANTMLAMGDLAGARALHEAVLEATARTLPEDHPDILLARHNLASTMLYMGDHVGARALQEAVLEATARTLPEEHPRLLTARNNLADTMNTMGDLAGARALQKAVLEAVERTLPEDHPDIITARGNLALTLADMGDFADARALQEAVLEASERTLPEDHSDILAARHNLADAMRHMDDLAGARALQEAVLEARERTLPEDHPVLLKARSSLAHTLTGLEAWDELAAQTAALTHGVAKRFTTALTHSTRASGESARTGADLLSLLLFFTSSLDAPAPLVESTFEALALARHVATARGVRLKEEEAERELERLRWEVSRLRGRLNDLLAAEGDLDGGVEVASLVLERDRVERRLREQLFASGAFLERFDADALAAALPTNAAAVDYRRYKRYTIDPEHRGTLWSTESLLAHVLDKDGTLQRVELGQIDELEALVETWRGSLGKPLFGRGMGVGAPAESSDRGAEHLERATGAALRERILDPVLEAAGHDVTTLFVCLDDALHLVPLDALPWADNPNDGPGNEQAGSLVGEHIDLRFDVSFARLLLPPPPVVGEPRLVALGGVDFAGGPANGDTQPARPIFAMANTSRASRAGPGGQLFGRLPGTRLEVETIGERFRQAFETDPVVLSDNTANKDGLGDEAPNARWLHIATHGYFAPESVRSQADSRAEHENELWTRSTLEERITGLAPMTLCGLALAGANKGRDSLGRVPGILTAEELAGWDLSSCELAVLSACETNVGITRAGQGLQSLQAALHAAGARASITSLWKVDDELTRKLMEDFYTRLWVNDEPKAEALWNAKMALKKQGAQTRDWAGWVLVGDPD